MLYIAIIIIITIIIIIIIIINTVQNLNMSIKAHYNNYLNYNIIIAIDQPYLYTYFGFKILYISYSNYTIWESIPKFNCGWKKGIYRRALSLVGTLKILSGDP